jgi:hypothetical protein
MAEHDSEDARAAGDTITIRFRPCGAASATALWLAELRPGIQDGHVVLDLVLKPPGGGGVARAGSFIISAAGALSICLRILGAVVRLREGGEAGPRPGPGAGTGENQQVVQCEHTASSWLG